MDRIILFLGIFLIISCTQETSSQYNNEVINENNDQRILVENIQKQQQYNELGIVVPLPYQMMVNKTENLTIQENGIIDFDNKVIFYKNIDFEGPCENEVLLKIHEKNNLLGMNIQEQYFTGGIVGYTLIINLETKEIIMNQRDFVDNENNWVSLWDIFSIENALILYFGIMANAYDTFTGNILWTQTYKRKSGLNKTIVYLAYYIIDDVDGKQYKIYIDGKKEIFNN